MNTAKIKEIKKLQHELADKIAGDFFLKKPSITQRSIYRGAFLSGMTMGVNLLVNINASGLKPDEFSEQTMIELMRELIDKQDQ